MQFVRRALLTIFGASLPLLLLATAVNFSILRIVGSPGPVKQILSESGIYNSVVGNALDQAKKSSGGSSEVSLTDPAIKNASEESFNPHVVQDSSEKVIDGVYGWLDGKSSKPDFSIDLSDAKNNFAEKVGQAAKTKAATLPVCTSAPTTTDPFSATCIPPGVTPAQVGEQAKNDVLKGQGFLEHPVVTANSFKSATGNDSVFDGKLKNAPKQFQRAKKTPFILAGLTILAMLAIVFLSATKKTPFILAGLTILAMLAIVFLSATKRKGLRHVGITLALVGALMLAIAWGLNRVVAQNITPKIIVENKVLQNSVRTLATDLAHRIDQNYWIFGIAYTLLGLILIISTLFIGRNRSKKEPKQTSANEARPSREPEPHPVQRPAPPPRPKSRPRIQG
jgi:hypothetical protein